MKVRFTSKVFLAVAFFFVLALAGCKMKEPSVNDDEATDDVVPADMFNGKSVAEKSATGNEAGKSVPLMVKDEAGGMTAEEKSARQLQTTVKVGAHAKYLKRYEAGQRVFILSPEIGGCEHGNQIDCRDGLGRLLAELSQMCEIAEIDTMSGGFFVDFIGAGHYRYQAGVTATTALVVRVSRCDEKKTE